jgi:hypothetical protein
MHGVGVAVLIPERFKFFLMLTPEKDAVFFFHGRRESMPARWRLVFGAG